MNGQYHNRELSWLAFNERVLEEAEKPANPVLERLKFLAITASNLDEFFMVRVAYLHERSDEAGPTDPSGLSPREQLEAVLERASAFGRRQAVCYERLLGELRAADVRILSMQDLDERQLRYAEGIFGDEILPVLTPLAVDPSRPFPFLANKSLNLAIHLQDEEGEDYYAVVQVPSILPRFWPIPCDTGRAFLPLERLIEHRLGTLFDRHTLCSWGLFRLTRSADFDANDDADDLMEEMQRTIKMRKRGRPIRLELSGGPGAWRDFVLGRLKISPEYVTETERILDLATLMKVAMMEGGEALRLPPITSVEAADFYGEEDMFAAIAERDRLVHHPYQTFDHVDRFIQAAAEDENVLAIKQTLYRVSGKSNIIAQLVRAAELGKQVTVLVELKARFDEENNIQWAKRLERAGCHVIYGLTGLKTHCKITLVVRRESSGIRRYLHMATGNYNGSTARIYTDLGLFTCRASLGADASALFNHLTGYSRPPEYSRLVVAPTHMKPFFLRMIDGEISRVRRGQPGGIYFKANSLLDREIIDKLYEASSAGVPIRLLIRGICALVPGVPGQSENIRIRSVVGQLLEHSRVFVFENGGEPLVYSGSADLMPRNLDRRVELLFPIEDTTIKKRVLDVLELMWRDTTNAREQGADGIYRAVASIGHAVNSQKELARLARADLRRAREQLQEGTV